MKLKSVIPLLTLSAIWGCYYVASQKAVEQMSLFAVGIVIRFITMILLIIIMFQKGELKLLVKTRAILPRLILIGVLGYLLDITAFIGLSLSEAGSGTALLKCDILFVNLISMFIYKQKFSKIDWACTFVMLFGVLMVMKVDFTSFSFGNAGNIFFILSALFVSINAFIIKSVQKHRTCPAENNVIAFYNNIVTMILFTLTAIFTGTIGQLKTVTTNKTLLTALIFAGLGQTLVYIFYYRNLKRFPVWLVKVFLLFMPIVVSIISFVLFDDRMVFNQYMGMAIVLIGAFGILFEQRKKDTLTANN